MAVNAWQAKVSRRELQKAQGLKTLLKASLIKSDVINAMNHINECVQASHAKINSGMPLWARVTLQAGSCARLGVPYVRKGEKPEKPVLNRRAEKGSFQWLVQQYKERAGNTMAPDQLARRVRLLEKVCDSLTAESKKRRGDLPFAAMEKRHITEIRDTIAETAGAQDNAVKFISAMFGWAVENELAQRNPALRIKKQNSGDGFHTWTVDEVQQFEVSPACVCRNWRSWAASMCATDGLRFALGRRSDPQESSCRSPCYRSCRRPSISSRPIR
ncbi:hypothetical protein ACVJBD_003763 [Rhizobium mongolense]